MTKYYYHGSQSNIKDYLKPRPSSAINNEKAVFATNLKWLAVFFGTKHSGNDIQSGFYGDTPYLEEVYPGAFDLLKVSVYLYYVNEDQFKSDTRCGLQGCEFISKKKVKILKKVKIKNAYTYLKRQKQIKFVTFDIKMKAIDEYFKKK